METWRMMERKIDSSQLEHSGDPDNLSIDGSFKGKDWIYWHNLFLQRSRVRGKKV